MHATVGEIAVGGVDAQRQGARLEKAEERAQLMVDHQRVALAAAGRGQQDGGVDQCVLVDEVEEMLEQPCVRAAIDRRAHHQHIGLLDGGQLAFHGVGQLRTPERTGQLRGQFAQFDQVLLAVDVLADQAQQMLGQGGGLGGALQSAGHGDDSKGAGR
ncbi:hypothetical protein VM57_10660 [Stenotrophomonas maltophilia]|uniref:Uncharacterized protein n=1 Tax=Stenotrophomonas maltophilia TaxID=40324 RepID=A0A0F5ZNP9_STEMA|nr:hypothetical protein VM57_10660 [Stenotrophomonas maltophilia]